MGRGNRPSFATSVPSLSISLSFSSFPFLLLPLPPFPFFSILFPSVRLLPLPFTSSPHPFPSYGTQPWVLKAGTWVVLGPGLGSRMALGRQGWHLLPFHFPPFFPFYCALTALGTSASNRMALGHLVQS